MGGKLREFRELRDNLSEGLRFYMSLQEAIAILRQQAGDYVLTRRLQRCWSTTRHSLKGSALGSAVCGAAWSLHTCL